MTIDQVVPTTIANVETLAWPGAALAVPPAASQQLLPDPTRADVPRPPPPW